MRRIGIMLATAMIGWGGFAHAIEPIIKDQGDRVSGAPQATRSAVLGVNGMAATSQPLATQVALDILKAGGTAVDAAIAANAALGLMEPTGNGIGGDLFAIIWDPRTKKLHGLNASGRSPLGQTLAQLKKANGGKLELPPHGWLPVTVPGAVDGWFEMHGKFGKLPMSQILAPTVSYAEAGFPISEAIAYYWDRNIKGFERSASSGMLQEAGNMRRVYTPNGRSPVEGEIFRNPDLARTLKTIGEKGRDAFYKGELGDVMDAYFQRISAPHRKSDLAAHKSEWIDPVSVNYRGYDVWELPPNGQGIAALQMLNILEAYDLKAMGRQSADFWHVMVEAKKIAFADRAKYYADPAFVKAPVRELLSDDYAAARRKLIRMDQAAKSVDAGIPDKAGRDTIYMTVADKDGMMVSLIQSNYRGMGSGLVPGSADGRTLGFMLQDRGEMFAMEAGHANAYQPGKRPFHTIIPAFITKDGQPWLSFGLMGGAMQPQGHAQIVVNMVDFGMNVQAAGDAARFHHDGSTEPLSAPPMTDGGKIELEAGVPAAVVAELKKRGHQVEYVTGAYGGYQAILRDPKTGVYWGASEFRKDGQAAGY
ncbi:gamma-glutamyltransferase [Sphingoaurantiacus capsulatus]|uniref:Glutathione hydrolase proenzyme n=1 Tax=Sphingoaurantiacus capsulatus TaxID=1771310 RepID=A0ABV7XAJ3_9SPHN